MSPAVNAASQTVGGAGRNGSVTGTYDALIIGAGISGMYMLIKLRELGLSVRVVEAGSDVGGVWYWNRYPGARLDSESYTYGYSFSKELLDEWEWSEVFSGQPENLRYLRRVAEKFDLKRDIQFNSKVEKATFDEAGESWTIELADGGALKGKYLISAMGPVSAVQMPAIEGRESFAGDSWHTADWPRDPNGLGPSPYDFSDKRVGVIGTGATAIQVIQELAKDVGELFVFQRSGNWCAPLGNAPIAAEEMAEIKQNYPEIFALCRKHPGSFVHDAIDKSALEASNEERNALFAKQYDAPGFGIWFGTFNDVLTDMRANDLLTEFAKRKIRERVKDSHIAEKLMPKDHGFGMRRLPLETHYYEVYNQDNVHLVDCLEDPIERITPSGIETSSTHYDLDVLIYATGFDTVVGALKRVEIRGVGGQLLKEKWKQGPQTYLGVQSAGFPNFFIMVGPHSGATFCNIPRCIEEIVEWTAEFIGHLKDEGFATVDVEPEAEKEWTQHVYEVAETTLFSKADSWFNGKNYNDPEAVKTFLMYAGGGPAYREILSNVKAEGYKGFRVSPPADVPSANESDISIDVES